MIKDEKPDLMVNPSGVEKVLLKAKEQEAGKKSIPVRINNITVVLLSPEKCNENYITRLKNRYNKY
jgi:hypothetical protein